MDQERFEELVRSVNAAGTRREAVQRFVGGALASALAVFGLADADAEAKGRKGKHSRKGDKGKNDRKSNSHRNPKKNKGKQRKKGKDAQPRANEPVTICHQHQLINPSVASCDNTQGHCTNGGGHENDCTCFGTCPQGGVGACSGPCVFCNATTGRCRKVCIVTGATGADNICVENGECCSGRCCNGTCIAAGGCCTVADCTPNECQTVTSCTNNSCVYASKPAQTCGNGTGCCNNGACDTSQKLCGSICIPAGDCCTDGDCKQDTDKCKQANGTCTAGKCNFAPIACPAAPVCQTGAGTCHSDTGKCTYDNAPAGECTDNGTKGCCSNGKCDTSLKLCNGACIPTGDCCTDGDCKQDTDKCKQANGTCTAGKCDFADIPCGPAPVCQQGAGTCDSATGKCSYDNAPASGCTTDSGAKGCCRGGACDTAQSFCAASQTCCASGFTCAGGGCCANANVCGNNCCGGDTPFCNTSTNTCVACRTAADCRSGCCLGGVCATTCICQHSDPVNPLFGCMNQCTAAGCTGENCGKICGNGQNVGACPVGQGGGNPCSSPIYCDRNRYTPGGSGRNRTCAFRAT